MNVNINKRLILLAFFSGASGVNLIYCRVINGLLEWNLIVYVFMEMSLCIYV
jgi:hypothetical protein